MVTDATKKYRDLLAYGLLAVAVLALIAALSLLFKSGDDIGNGVGFAEKAAIFGSLFESGLTVLALVGAVVLVTRLGEPSSHARIVVLAALAVASIFLLFAVITLFAQFGADSTVIGDHYAGVNGAGKAVGAILGLAQLLFLALVVWYFVTALQSLPAPAGKPAQQWGAGPGFGPYGAPNQQAWGQPGQGYGQGGQQAWGQPPAPSYGWAASPGGWSDPATGWHDPAAAQQGQPASSWSQAGQEWAPPGSSSAGQWDQPAPSTWAQPAGASEWTPQAAGSGGGDSGAPPPEPGPDPSVTTVSPDVHTPAADDVAASAESSPAPSEPAASEPPPEQGGWWRRPQK